MPFFSGNFLTQALSIILTTIGICLLTFATWQYTVYPPDCCYGNTSQLFAGDVYDSFTVNWNTNCSELHKVTILNQINLHISPTVIMVLAITGLTVCMLYTLLNFGQVASFHLVFEHCVCPLLPSAVLHRLRPHQCHTECVHC